MHSIANAWSNSVCCDDFSGSMASENTARGMDNPSNIYDCNGPLSEK